MPDLLEQASGPRGEVSVRRQIDRAIGRALFDPAFARALLTEPSLALGDLGCSPQQLLALHRIRATDLKDLAIQVEALFWPARQNALPDRAPLAASASFALAL